MGNPIDPRLMRCDEFAKESLRRKAEKGMGNPIDPGLELGNPKKPVREEIGGSQ